MNEAFKSAILLFQEKNFETALQKLLSLRLPESDKAMQCYYIGLCYVQLHDHEKALLYLSNTLSLGENFLYEFQSRMIIGYVYAVINKHKLAIREFAQLLADGYESAKVYAALAHSLYHLNKVEESITMLKRAIELEPDNANALNSLGYIMTSASKDIDQAVQYCQKAVSMQPYNPAYLDSLAMAYYRQEKVTDAVNLLKQAYVLSGDNPDIKQHMLIVSQRKQ